MKKTFIALLFCVASVCSFATYCSAAELAGTTSLALEGIGDILSNNLNSSQTFGNPVTVGDYTVIPVVSKSVIFGLGTKLEDFDRANKKSNSGNSENKAKDRITLGAIGQSRPVALIFIGKNGEFKVTKLDDGFVNQLAQYIAPKIPVIIGKLIEYKKKYFSNRAKKYRAKKSHKKIRKHNKISNRKRTHRKNKSPKHSIYKRGMDRKYYLSPRQHEMKKVHEKYFKNRKFPKHQMLQKDQIN